MKPKRTKPHPWVESFNRKPTAAEEADFYRRNAGGPVAMTSMTRGRGALGYQGQYDLHLLPYWSHLRTLDPSLPWPPLSEEDIRLGCENQNAADRAWREKLKRSAPRPRRRPAP